MNRTIRFRSRILCAFLLCLVLVPTGVWGEAGTDAQVFPKATARSQIVRVRLSRLNILDRLDITLDGVYSLGNPGESSMIFERGSKLSFLVKNDALMVHYEGMSFNAGASVYLTRYQGEEKMENGIRLTGEKALYEGDLQLDVDGGLIRPTLHIHVEDYLLGVVPYEMSNDFPLEALKAQAVTARTYALRKQDATKAYDLVDTTNDQVFRGTLPGYDRATQAVTETRGMCGFYKGELAQCFYGASNGGQTELVQNVWGGSGADYGYYAMTDDPYDLENPFSMVKTFTVAKKPGKNDTASYGLRNLLVDGLRAELEAKGYDPAPESLRLDEVLALSVDTPAHGNASRVMTRLHITFKYSGRTRTDSEPVVSVQQSLVVVDDDVEEVSLFTQQATKAATAAPFAEASITPQPAPAPTPPPVYGKFEPVDEAVTLQLPLFASAAKQGETVNGVSALALDLNSGYDNEVVTVVEKGNAFVVEARRYGHGVGMSQRGAEWMASKHRKTFDEILSFYYPGMEIQVYEAAADSLPVLDPERLATAGPPPTPTPRPTPMPVTGTLPVGAWYATVTEIDEDSSLNLRSTPDMSGEILMRLYKNQRLLVVEKCPEEGWVKVRTDVIEGYVMEQFLTKE